MDGLFRLPGATRRDPAIDAWLDSRPSGLGAIGRAWFDYMRACGDDVCELMHDGRATACVGDAAFGYVGVFKAHVVSASSLALTWTIPRAFWRAPAGTCAT